MNANDIELALRSRAAFNDSVQHLDSDTRRRLRELRVRALDGSFRRSRPGWIWACGAAATAVLVLAVFVPRVPTSDRFPTVSQASPPVQALASQADPAHAPGSAGLAGVGTADLEQAPSVETADPDTLDELGFYRWLAAQQAAGKTGG